MERKKLPIGIQTFEEIIAEGYRYVDKTGIIYKMVSEGKVYFLSRPRRFGKSLLVSTLEAYFQGRKNLFEGLAIESLEKEWNEYPVIRIDFSEYASIGNRLLISQIDSILSRYENIFSLKSEGQNDIIIRFTNLINNVYTKTGKKVVVLIDEYDKPILDVISDEASLKKNREILRGFYGVLKAADPYLKFVFLTGITKFSQVSIFSGLNQLEDISMRTDYDSICGITEDELTSYFHDEISRLASEQKASLEDTVNTLRRMYDGYHFSRRLNGVYNPFCILNVLKSCEYGNYWFQSGNPTYLLEVLKNSQYDITRLEGITLGINEFANYRADAEMPVPILYQSGYLTIKGYNERTRKYVLGYPNEEVKESFIEFIAPMFIPDLSESAFSIDRFREEIWGGDTEAFMTRFQSLVSSVDYRIFDDKAKEKHFQFIFYLVFTLSGAEVHVEESTSGGRMDAVLKTDDNIFIFEFKLDRSADEALEQIEEKHYADPYLSDGRNIVLVGANFLTEGRRLDSWKIKR